MKLRQFPEGVSRTSWRTQEVRLKPYESYDISFYDTNPNIFAVSNPNEATLKFGIGKMPTSEKYEYKINYSSSDVFGRPIGTGHLYVLNDSSLEVSFTLFSVDTEFTPDILKGTNVIVDLDNLETRAVIQGQTEGFKLKVEDTVTAEKLGEVVETLGEVSEALTTIKPPVIGYYKSRVSTIRHIANETGNVVFDWLFNDGDDAVVAIDDLEYFQIKTGEGFGDMAFYCTEGQTLTVKSNTGTASLRAKFHVEV